MHSTVILLYYIIVQFQWVSCGIQWYWNALPNHWGISGFLRFGKLGAATQRWDCLVGAQSLVLIMFLQCSESNLICQFNIIFIIIHIYHNICVYIIYILSEREYHVDGF